MATSSMTFMSQKSPYGGAYSTVPNPSTPVSNTLTAVPKTATATPSVNTPNLGTGMGNVNANKPIVSALQTVAAPKTNAAGQAVNAQGMTVQQMSAAAGKALPSVNSDNMSIGQNQGAMAMQSALQTASGAPGTVDPNLTVGAYLGNLGSANSHPVSSALTGAVPTTATNPATAPKITGQSIDQTNSQVGASVAGYTDDAGVYHAGSNARPTDNSTNGMTDATYTGQLLNSEAATYAAKTGLTSQDVISGILAGTIDPNQVGPGAVTYSGNAQTTLDQENKASVAATDAAQAQMTQEANAARNQLLLQLGREGLQPGRSSYADQQLADFNTKESVLEKAEQAKEQADELANEGKISTDAVAQYNDAVTQAQKAVTDDIAVQNANTKQTFDTGLLGIDKLKASIQQELADGTITKDQADALLAAANANSANVQAAPKAAEETANAAATTALTPAKVANLNSSTALNNEKTTKLLPAQIAKLKAAAAKVVAGKGGVYSAESVSDLLTVASQIPNIPNLTDAEKAAQIKAITAMPHDKQAAAISAIKANVNEALAESTQTKLNPYSPETPTGTTPTPTPTGSSGGNDTTWQ